MQLMITEMRGKTEEVVRRNWGEIKEKEASNVAEERYEGIGPRCGR